MGSGECSNGRIAGRSGSTRERPQSKFQGVRGALRQGKKYKKALAGQKGLRREKRLQLERSEMG